jgi:hypothetical protein
MLAPVYARDGRGTNRPRLDAARGGVVSCAAVALALRAGRGSEAGCSRNGPSQLCPQAEKSAHQGSARSIGETRTALFTI